MLVKANRNATIDFTCPSCGQKFKKTLGWMESHPKFACPNSACDQGFDGSKFTKEIDGALDDAERQLRDAFKKLK